MCSCKNKIKKVAAKKTIKPLPFKFTKTASSTPVTSVKFVPASAPVISNNTGIVFK